VPARGGAGSARRDTACNEIDRLCTDDCVPTEVQGLAPRSTSTAKGDQSVPVSCLRGGMEARYGDDRRCVGLLHGLSAWGVPGSFRKTPSGVRIVLAHGYL